MPRRQAQAHDQVPYPSARFQLLIETRARCWFSLPAHGDYVQFPQAFLWQSLLSNPLLKVTRFRQTESSHRIILSVSARDTIGSYAHRQRRSGNPPTIFVAIGCFPFRRGTESGRATAHCFAAWLIPLNGSPRSVHTSSEQIQLAAYSASIARSLCWTGLAPHDKVLVEHRQNDGGQCRNQTRVNHFAFPAEGCGVEDKSTAKSSCDAYEHAHP